MTLFSRNNTQALKGFAAIAIFIFHILLAYNISPIFNMWGGLFVAVFLILSGYGLEESYRQNGLDRYWEKRMDKVILPTAFFICAYNFIFPHLSFTGDSSAGASMHKCLDELLYITPTFWFVFFILKCYAVYWIGTRFMGERLRLFFFVVCSLICLNIQSPCGHQEAEQSFSFLAGVLLSMYKHRINAFSKEKVRKYMFLLLFVGAAFMCLKSVPFFHGYKGTVAYNYMLCPFRLSTGLAFIPLLTMLRVGKSTFMRIAGKYSLEIYIAHIPFIGMITDAKSTGIFIVCSVIAFFLLMLYRTFIEKKLSIAGTLFIAVNVLFVAKYSARVAESLVLYATLSAVVFYYILLRFAIPYIIDRNKRVACGVCLLGLTGMVVMQCSVDPYAIQVDRWSALHFPIQNLLSGIYPYIANTHLGGSASPFPVWQILHIPFYFMNNVGLSVFAAIVFFLWSCHRIQGGEKACTVCLLLCSSVAVWYEVAVRSDLITNFLFLAATVNLVFHRMNQQWVEENRWWIACAVGLLTCTRVLVLIPVTLLLLPYFVRMNRHSQIAVLLLTLTVFVLTFVPFAIWDWQDFFYSQYSPWALQTRQGNLSDFVVFIPLAIFLAVNHKGEAGCYYRNSAVMLVAFVLVTFVHNMYAGENWSLFSSAYDITYLSTALPFCMLAIGESRSPY